MSYETAPLVNWPVYTNAQTALGVDFVRILGYFREDGIKSVQAVEDAMQKNDARDLIIPSHTVKGEAFQFGAEKLALTSEYIELTARECVEQHINPDQLIVIVAGYRRLFEETMDQLESRAVPAAPGPAAVLRPARAGGFGRKGL